MALSAAHRINRTPDLLAWALNRAGAEGPRPAPGRAMAAGALADGCDADDTDDALAGQRLVACRTLAVMSARTVRCRVTDALGPGAPSAPTACCVGGAAFSAPPASSAAAARPSFSSPSVLGCPPRWCVCRITSRADRRVEVRPRDLAVARPRCRIGAIPAPCNQRAHPLVSAFGPGSGGTRNSETDLAD